MLPKSSYDSEHVRVFIALYENNEQGPDDSCRTHLGILARTLKEYVQEREILRVKLDTLAHEYAIMLQEMLALCQPALAIRKAVEDKNETKHTSSTPHMDMNCPRCKAESAYSNAVMRLIFALDEMERTDDSVHPA